MLEDVGALAFNAVDGRVRPPAGEELELVRAVARADASVGRIFDGHLNGVERLAVQAPPALRAAELAAVRDRRLRVGVWGGDPRPGEGPAATVERRGATETLSGVKTFCSGAGWLDRALVLARDPAAPLPVAVWIDLTDARFGHGRRGLVPRLRIAGLGLASGRVSTKRRCWRGLDRRAACLSSRGSAATRCAPPRAGRGWPTAPLDAALDELGARPDPGPLEQLAAGRMLTAQQTIAAWLQRAAPSDGRRGARSAGGRAACAGRDRAGVAGAVGRGRPRLRIASVRDRRRARSRPA